MAKEWENTINDAVAKFIGAIGDVAKLEITTYYVDVSAGGAADFDNAAKPVAKTVIELAGDFTDYVPVRLKKETTESKGDPTVDRELYRLHQENVEKAIQYRDNMFSSVMAGIKSLMG